MHPRDGFWNQTRGSPYCGRFIGKAVTPQVDYINGGADGCRISWIWDATGDVFMVEVVDANFQNVSLWVAPNAVTLARALASPAVNAS